MSYEFNYKTLFFIVKVPFYDILPSCYGLRDNFESATWLEICGWEKGLEIKGFVAGEEVELKANVLSKILSSTIPFRESFSSFLTSLQFYISYRVTK